MQAAALQTDRLLLRQWRDADRAPFAALNADPEVMAHFAAPLTRVQSDTLVDRIVDDFARNGFDFWAVEILATGEFIGFVGLHRVDPRMPLPTGSVEIGWRLARRFWGSGYASEAATAALGFGFDRLGLAEILSFTAVPNERSQRVMRRIGMTRDEAGDFDHPALPEGHRLRRHVLYRLAASDWPVSAEASA